MRRPALVSAAALAAALPAAPAPGQIVLTDQTATAGLSALHQPDAAAIPGPQDWMTGGLGVGDFNGDGCMDIFWVGGGLVPDRLYINHCDGTGTFTDEAAAWGVAAAHAGNGVAIGDYDGDGRPDIYVTSFGYDGAAVAGSHRLYRNDGGSFTELAVAAGVERSCPAPEGDPNPAGYGAAFGDYDLDGDLDLCVTSWWGDDDGNRLFRNEGDGTFTDVTVAALGTAVDGVWGFQPAFIDMDGDRWPELLIAADFETSRYLLNNRDGTFTDITVASGTGLDDNGMGQAVADFTHNGFLDWYVTSVHSTTPPPDNPGNMFYLGLGGHQYQEVSNLNGVNDGGWGWGTVAVDLDQDGWTDIAEVNGRPAKGSEWINEPAKLFYNNPGNFSFTEMAAAAGFDHADEGRGLAYLDADQDGDLDLVVATYAGPLTYYRNDTPGAGNWLQVTLDTAGNALLAPDGFGTRVIAVVGGQEHIQYISSAPSYLATSQPVAHFGLGDAAAVDELRLEWARGQVTVMSDVAANQHLMVTAPPLGDLDGDGAVGVTDFLGLLAAWGPCAAPPEPCLADLDADGSVGTTDFLLLLSNWG